VRYSVGIENVADLIEDLRQALEPEREANGAGSRIAISSGPPEPVPPGAGAARIGLPVLDI